MDRSIRQELNRVDSLKKVSRILDQLENKKVISIKPEIKKPAKDFISLNKKKASEKRPSKNKPEIVFNSRLDRSMSKSVETLTSCSRINPERSISTLDLRSPSIKKSPNQPKPKPKKIDYYINSPQPKPKPISKKASIFFNFFK